MEKRLKFSEYKNDILAAIKQKFNDDSIFEKYFLLESFLNEPIYNELINKLYIAGPTIPMVAIVDKVTGEIKIFALKMLLPNIDI